MKSSPYYLTPPPASLHMPETLLSAPNMIPFFRREETEESWTVVNTVDGHKRVLGEERVDRPIFYLPATPSCVGFEETLDYVQHHLQRESDFAESVLMLWGGGQKVEALCRGWKALTKLYATHQIAAMGVYDTTWSDLGVLFESTKVPPLVVELTSRQFAQLQIDTSLQHTLRHTTPVVDITDFPSALTTEYTWGELAGAVVRAGGAPLVADTVLPLDGSHQHPNLCDRVPLERVLEFEPEMKF